MPGCGSVTIMESCTFAPIETRPSVPSAFDQRQIKKDLGRFRQFFEGPEVETEPCRGSTSGGDAKTNANKCRIRNCGLDMVAEVEGLVTVKSETLSLAGPEGYRQVASMRTHCEKGHRQMFLIRMAVRCKISGRITDGEVE